MYRKNKFQILQVLYELNEFNVPLEKMTECMLYYIPVPDAEGKQAPGLQGNDFFPFEPFQRLAQLFTEEFPVEADLA
jgi:hypothetical protein